MPILTTSAAPGKKAAPKAAPRRRAPAPTGPPPSAQTVSAAAEIVTPPSPPPTQPVILDKSAQIESKQTQSRDEPQPLPQPAQEPSPARALIRDPSPRSESQRSEPADDQYVPERASVSRSASQPSTGEISALVKEAFDKQHARPAEAEIVTQPVVTPISQLDSTPSDIVSLPQQLNVQQEQAEQSHEPTLSFAEQALGPLLQPIPGRSEEQAQVTNVGDGHITAATGSPQPVEATAKPKRGTKRVRIQEKAEIAGQPRKAPKRSSARSNAKVQATVEAGGQEPETSSMTAGPDVTMKDAEATTEPKPTRKRRIPAKSVTTQRKGKAKVKSAETIVNSDDEGADEGFPATGADIANQSQIRQNQSADTVEPATVATPSAKLRKPRKPRQYKKKTPTATTKGQENVAGTQAEGTKTDHTGNDAQTGKDDHNSEEDELHEIDPNTVSMFELSHDTRYGKRSDRGKAMAGIDWDAEKEKRRAAAQAIIEAARKADPTVPKGDDTAEPGGDVAQTTEGEDGTAASAVPDGDAALDEDQTEVAPEQGISAEDTGGQFEAELIMNADGEIVVDPESITVDDNAQARAAAANVEDAEVVDDLTVMNNRLTWLNTHRRDPIDKVPAWKWKSDPWSEEETDRFYEQLRMFGTDFFIISKMFPEKTRRMIKAKFNREEKLDPRRIDKAMSGISTTPMNLEHYAQETGHPLEYFTKVQSYDHTMSIINEETRRKYEDESLKKQQEAEKKIQEEKEKKAAEKEAKRAKKKEKRTKQKKAAGTLGGGQDSEEGAGQ